MLLGFYDTNSYTKASLISYINCTGFETSIDQCKLTLSSSSDRCFQAASISCNSGQKIQS